MDRTALDLWVGIFVVAGLAALSVLALKVGNLSSYNMSETYQLQAIFRISADLNLRRLSKALAY